MEHLNTPFFGLTISVIAFELGVYINKKTRISILNPLIISIALIIGFLLCFDIEYDVYNKLYNIFS